MATTIRNLARLHRSLEDFDAARQYFGDSLAKFTDLDAIEDIKATQRELDEMQNKLTTNVRIDFPGTTQLTTDNSGRNSIALQKRFVWAIAIALAILFSIVLLVSF